MTGNPVESEVCRREASGCGMSTGEAAGLHAARAEVLLPRDLIHDDEVVILLLRPSPLFIPLSSLGSLAIIAIITLSAMWLARLSWVPFSDVLALELGIGVGLLRLAWQGLEWVNRIYVLTDRRIIRRRGVLRVAVFETQLKNIQHTSVFARLRERLFGLGSIGFATAGSSTFEAFWVMIRKPYAVHHTVVEAIHRYGH